MEQDFLDLKLKTNTETKGIAIFSKDNKHRFVLSRDWAPQGEVLTFIMLNPSIGNESILEHTTQTCAIRAKQWGYSGILILNLFSYISTNPNDLTKVCHPEGDPHNIYMIKNIIRELPEQADIIAAWGRMGKLFNRDKQVIEAINRPLLCLGINQDGTPSHPLHLPYKNLPRPFLAKGEV